MQDKIEGIMEGIEENYCRIDQELEPALIEIGTRFEADDLEPFVSPFLKWEFMNAMYKNNDDSKVNF